MPLTGELFIGATRSATSSRFHGVSALTGEPLQPAFSAAGHGEVAHACGLAAAAADAYRNSPIEVRARFLEQIAAGILDLGDELLQRAHLESGLALPRLTTERARTIGQLQLFARELRQGSWQGIRIDPALPERKPLARADLRQIKVAIGPVAVFGASNFPLAFSVAGGDTAAALAAGCPVVAKGHPAHPGTGELVAQAIAAAARSCSLPEGVFSLLNGPAHELGAALAASPQIEAVAFTGSRAGGLALLKIANARPVPIPVYAEMSSINPVILLEGALSERAEPLAQQFVSSLTLGAGQFCTNPGLVLAIESANLDRFEKAAAAALRPIAPAVMLTSGIHAAYEGGVQRLLGTPGVTSLARAEGVGGYNCGAGALFMTSAATLSTNSAIAEEVFGAAAVIVRCRDAAELAATLAALEGQLTATLHLTSSDHPLASRLLPLLERKAGRLIANGWPTGVEVSHAMVHGGPFPATSDGRSTSVGTLAIERFLRPVCYQDFPDELLPPHLRRGAQAQLPHRLDGVLQTP